MNKRDKERQLDLHPNCYVCEALGLPNSDFTGYELSEIQFDHWKPKGLVGGSQAQLIANQLPIHAAKDGADYQSEDFETAVVRNCHKGKGNRFKSGQDWVDGVRIWRGALATAYSDDLLTNRRRNGRAYKVNVNWGATPGHVRFRRELYPMMVQSTPGEKGADKWKSFSTLVPAKLLWRDKEVQSRPADQKRLAELAIHLRTNPLLSPILCRLANGNLNVFDGNHRLCAFILARPNDPVPVTIFEGPDPKAFLDVVAKAHDELTQQKYQYSAKALKYSALNENELHEAEAKYGNMASEKMAWEELRAPEVRLRIVGKITERLDEEGGWREKWKKLGLTDKSRNDFIGLYARLKPEAAPFSSREYARDNELHNLIFLCQVFDEELFEKLSRNRSAKASLKTKWWKMAHKRFVTRAAQVIRDSLKLPETPVDPAYTPKKWDSHVKRNIRRGVKRWRDSPAWRHPTTANNEPDVAEHLNAHNFTENYLM